QPAIPEGGIAGLFDRRAWRAHRQRAAGRSAVNFLHEEIADRLLDRLDVVNRRFAAALDLGARDLYLTRLLEARSDGMSVVAAEPAAAFLTPGAGQQGVADP